MRKDEGTIVILVAVALLALMGFAAIAIDLGSGWNERRQDQTAADLAAVAGALSYGNNSAVVDNVLLTARNNLDRTYSNAEWNQLWANCADPDRPPGFTPMVGPTGTLDCVSINPSFLRVKLPEQLVATSFGRVVGVESLATDADTIVTLLPREGNGLLPFAVRGNSSSGELCLDTDTGQIDEPCETNESGSFGNIAPPLFGNPYMGTSPACGAQTSANNYVPEAIAMGTDHLIWRFSSAKWSATGWSPDEDTNNNDVDDWANMDECVDTGGEVAEAADGVPIEAVYVDTGNSTKADSTEGLITGTNFPDGKDARLTRSSNTRDLDGYDVDNTPLWEHLTNSHTVTGCKKSDITAGNPDLDEKNQRMRDCLEGYGSSGPQIFADSIMDTPRFGVAPILWHNNLGSGMSYRPVKEFGLIYLAGIWMGNGSNPDVFYPDDEDNSPVNTPSGNWTVGQVTAYFLEPDMVSKEVQEFYPGFDPDALDVSIYE